MSSIKMDLPQLKADSEKWMELEQECIDIVNNIDTQLENISLYALKTPILNEEFNKLRELYASIEKTLITNINAIKDFFAKQFTTYDNLGVDVADATSNVANEINVNADTSSNPVFKASNIANSATSSLGTNFNESSVSSNKLGAEGFVVTDNSLDDPLANVGKEVINHVDTDKTLTTNIHGLAEANNEAILNNGSTIVHPKMNEFSSNVYGSGVEIGNISNNSTSEVETN